MGATLRDCIYGQAVGDALGVPYEFMARDTFECAGMAGHGTHDQPADTWSDDTSMTLAICDSYRELRRIDVEDIRARFLAWYREDAYTCGRLFDIGNATAAAPRLGNGSRRGRTRWHRLWCWRHPGQVARDASRQGRHRGMPVLGR